jgi:hypothetical protein
LEQFARIHVPPFNFTRHRPTRKAPL